MQPVGSAARTPIAATATFNFGQERKNLQQEAEADPADHPSAQQKRRLEELAELLERFWDASRHPRGGFPENRGWFSPS
jgi:hypothetical protein